MADNFQVGDEVGLPGDVNGREVYFRGEVVGLLGIVTSVKSSFFGVVQVLTDEMRRWDDIPVEQRYEY